jgi:Amt family ammonium transporter
MTGLLATTAVNAAGANGLLHGNPQLLFAELVGIVVALGWSFGITFGALKIIDATIGLRVSPEEEYTGLDLTEHSEKGYIYT